MDFILSVQRDTDRLFLLYMQAVFLILVIDLSVRCNLSIHDLFVRCAVQDIQSILLQLNVYIRTATKKLHSKELSGL